MEPNFDIVNIKASTKLFLPFTINSLLDHIREVNKCCTVKKISNMIIVKSAVYVYIIFASKINLGTIGNWNQFHCNITGISNLNLVERAIDYFYFLFFPNLKNYKTHPQIDSITSKFNYVRGINIHSIYSKTDDPSIINKKLNLHTFPSLKIRFKENGCAQIYSSGKCILLGQKSVENLQIAKLKLDNIINNNNAHII